MLSPLPEVSLRFGAFRGHHASRRCHVHELKSQRAVRDDAKHRPFKIVKKSDGHPAVEPRCRHCSRIFRHARRQATGHIPACHSRPPPLPTVSTTPTTPHRRLRFVRRNFRYIHLGNAAGCLRGQVRGGDIHLGDEAFGVVLVEHVMAEFKRRGPASFAMLPRSPVHPAGRSQLAIHHRRCLWTQAHHREAEPLPVRVLVQRTFNPCKKAPADATRSFSSLVVDTVKSIYGREPSKGVDPDEAIAIGMMSLPERHRNSPPRCSFSSSMTAIEAKIYPGERELVRDNKLLGKFNLVGIPPASKDVPWNEIIVDIMRIHAGHDLRCRKAGDAAGRPWHALQAQTFTMTQQGAGRAGLRESAYGDFAGFPNLVMDLQTAAVLQPYFQFWWNVNANGRSVPRVTLAIPTIVAAGKQQAQLYLLVFQIRSSASSHGHRAFAELGEGIGPGHWNRMSLRVSIHALKHRLLGLVDAKTRRMASRPSHDSSSVTVNPAKTPELFSSKAAVSTSTSNPATTRSIACGWGYLSAIACAAKPNASTAPVSLSTKTSPNDIFYRAGNGCGHPNEYFVPLEEYRSDS
ncbi:hypothetical protein DFP72DRAFT_844823 [Ephemerocybe angulata]|uniref:Uncharacterized protein n=1 Tax=Ephemerocybe angulata TaxID=980116 RepID=A0A8H6M7U0_9AGAR|nr:hypothetical protein DFP72DRAFT_844823 [Tulosesus angulatus]